MLEDLREELWQLHLELPKNDLVTWTSGNVSARDPRDGLRRHQAVRRALRGPADRSTW